MVGNGRKSDAPNPNLHLLFQLAARAQLCGVEKRMVGADRGTITIATITFAIATITIATIALLLSLLPLLH